jgi:hypothetical protein
MNVPGYVEQLFLFPVTSDITKHYRIHKCNAQTRIQCEYIVDVFWKDMHEDNMIISLPQNSATQCHTELITARERGKTAWNES